jgi:hypothetical protein
MRNEVDRRRCSGWFSRIRRGSAGALVLLAILVPTTIRPVTVAAAVQESTATSVAEPHAATASDDPGVKALRRGEIDLVATYRTSAEDPCLVLRRGSGDSHEAGERSPIAMLLRSRQLGLWVVYFATAGEAPLPSALHDAAARMRWRTSRGVHAIAIDPESPRAVEAAVSAWYAHCPPASESSLMATAIRSERTSEARRIAARRIAR